MAESDRQLDHLYVQGHAETESFHRKGGGPGKGSREVDRFAHGSALKGSLEDIFDTAGEQVLAALPTEEELRAAGTVIVLEGEGAAYPLKIDSLSNFTGGKSRKPRWLLLSVRGGEGQEPETATVWVSDEYRAKFLKLFEDYLDDEKVSRKGNPRNRELIANISRIRHAVLEDLWTSEGEPPRHGRQWWELWLDATSPHVGDIDQFVVTFHLSGAHERVPPGGSTRGLDPRVVGSA